MPRRRVPARGRIVTSWSAHRTRISGLEADKLMRMKIHPEQKRSRIQTPQRAIILETGLPYKAPKKLETKPPERRLPVRYGPEPDAPSVYRCRELFLESWRRRRETDSAGCRGYCRASPGLEDFETRLRRLVRAIGVLGPEEPGRLFYRGVVGREDTDSPTAGVGRTNRSKITRS